MTPEQEQATVYTTVRPMTRRERLADAFWESMRWLRCHILRQHFPVTEHRPTGRVGRAWEYERTGRLVCDVCGRRVG